MKRPLTILLLLVFLFYTGGYHIIFFILKHQSDKKLSRLFDSEIYEHSSTICIKIPLTLPYPIHATGFERINGEFEHAGRYYKMIKHKLENDTLHIVCFNDEKTTQLENAWNKVLEFSNTLPATSKLPWVFPFKFLSDYEEFIHLTFEHHSKGWTLFITGNPPDQKLILRPHPVQTPPPESC